MLRSFRSVSPFELTPLLSFFARHSSYLPPAPRQTMINATICRPRASARCERVTTPMQKITARAIFAARSQIRRRYARRCYVDNMRDNAQCARRHSARRALLCCDNQTRAASRALTYVGRCRDKRQARQRARGRAGASQDKRVRQGVSRARQTVRKLAKDAEQTADAPSYLLIGARARTVRLMFAY